mmetsp:Transcript_14802/g.22423  ORF Transcript_14802/g.22423 Transcript_14802/m.22423 type:complete len:87 (+) Transcript_14802:195-455(+)
MLYQPKVLTFYQPRVLMSTLKGRMSMPRGHTSHHTPMNTFTTSNQSRSRSQSQGATTTMDQAKAKEGGGVTDTDTVDTTEANLLSS